MASLDDVEMTKLFGRLADKYLLLDVPGAGTPGMINCCHGGCDNCDFSHVFDEMSSGRAKWLPLYPDRKLIDGRSHISPWASLFFEQPEEATLDAQGNAWMSSERGVNELGVDKQRFVARFKALPYRMTMGPPSSSVQADDVPLQTSLDAFWALLTDGGSDSALLTPFQMASKLQQVCQAEHGALWSDFIKTRSL